MSSVERPEQGKLIFCSIVYPWKSSETNALLLAESIRTFAGSLSKAPIWCFTPERGEQVSPAVKDRLLALGVALTPFEIDHETMQFPFTGEATASLAESMAQGLADFLVWMNANTMVLNEPKELLLPDKKNLGFRPVHHTLIGSRYDEPLDPFWTLIYRLHDVPDDRVFPMATHVDGEIIRPYFNAGFHVTRPEKRLLQAWRDAFLKVYREPALQEFYQQDPRYKVFIHQAVLSGVILSALKTDEIQELPSGYNYPIHLHAEDVTDHRPSSLEELVTIRHEGFYEDPNWTRKMPADEALKQWIAERIS
jgi:hypothetical protein